MKNRIIQLAVSVLIVFVAGARALIPQPKIIVADEPLTFVDEESAKTVANVFAELKEEGKTILISTHVSNLAKLADKTYAMKDGKIVKPA